jgi:hypothetical protein
VVCSRVCSQPIGLRSTQLGHAEKSSEPGWNAQGGDVESGQTPNIYDGSGEPRECDNCQL